MYLVDRTAFGPERRHSAPLLAVQQIIGDVQNFAGYFDNIFA